MTTEATASDDATKPGAVALTEGLGVTPDAQQMEEIELSMSNFYGHIDEGFAEALQARPGEVFGRHAGWDFNGRVYFYGGKFHEQVWVYGSVRAVISADTLRELFDAVCEQFGRD